MKIRIFLIIAFLAITAQIVCAENLRVRKTQVDRKLKTHPIESFFNKPNNPKDLKRDVTFENLLVLRVDFQIDDNPQTTGNGKFDLRDSSEYPISVGAPPHDRQFFHETFKSLAYYYKAASLDNYNLDYDIYPLNDTLAYTLPQEMAYYNPTNASQELMISRFEEYFTDVFTTADQDDDIVFSDYSHYMIIHAGSDYQHDIYGDTPNDIPSFFIKVGDGKEVYVDDNYPISYACNVPETISQDDEFGVINAVVAHEFGHSLGFVDLYNTRNYRPMVGSFDIMDSGGMGSIGFVNEGESEEDIVYIEGGLPILPSVWHRLLVWEDEFRQAGIYKELQDLPFNEEIELAPAERKLTQFGNPLYFAKIPMNENEYLLIENRQVDSDQKGDIEIKGSLPTIPGTNNYRVLLYPTAANSDVPSFEYDFMMPGWYRNDWSSTGGGLFLWHINDKIIYQDGFTDINGDFVSNYDNNTVNADVYNRGVELFEADGLWDIGNPYSLWWRGTAYEAFYRDKPQLDENNMIIGWDSSPNELPTHAGEFSSSTNPQFITTNDEPVWWRIYDISTFQNTMKFKLSTNLMEYAIKFSDFSDLKAVSPVFKSDQLTHFASIDDQKLSIFWNSESSELEGWNIFNEIDFEINPTQPLQSFDFDGNNNEKLVAIENDKLIFITPNDITEHTLSDTIINEPLFCRYENIVCSVFPFYDSLQISTNIPTIFNYDIPNAKLAFDGQNIIAISNEQLHRINIDNFEQTTLNLSAEVGDFSPVVFKNSSTEEINIFLQTNRGDILKIAERKVETIYNNEWELPYLPTQMSISDLADNDLATITFGVNNKAFAIDIDGSNLSGFPKIFDERKFAPYSNQEVVRFFESNIMLLQTNSNCYLAIDNNGEYRPEFSFFGTHTGANQHFYFSEAESRLYFLKKDGDNVYVSYISGYEDNPILSAQNNNEIFSSAMQNLIAEDDFSAYAYPNPAVNQIRFRVFSAEEDIEVQIYDVAGNRIAKQAMEKSPNNQQEIVLNTSDYQSGVYFGIIKSGNKTKKVLFGIEK